MWLVSRSRSRPSSWTPSAASGEPTEPVAAGGVWLIGLGVLVLVHPGWLPGAIL